MNDQTVLVTLTVKSYTLADAQNDVSRKLNEWFSDSTFRPSELGEPYPMGSLLHWGFYEPKLVGFTWRYDEENDLSVAEHKIVNGK